MCAHPQREAIEAAFLRFESAAQIASAHGIADRRSIYRHAHALGLFVRRNRAFACSLELLLEKAPRFEPSVNDVIRATEKYSKISADGESIRRPKPVDIYVPIPASSLEELGTCLENLAISNRHNSELEITVSHSKQTTEIPSNRHKFEGCPSRTKLLDAGCVSRVDPPGADPSVAASPPASQEVQ